MGFRTLIFLLFLVKIIPTTLASQNLKFEYITPENGLSQSSVTSIIQDKDGYIWFGTLNGLNKYDGYKFVKYYHNSADSLSIIDDQIECLFQDSQGNLWIGNEKGLSLYNRDRDVFKNYEHEQNNPNSISGHGITCIFEDKKERLWVGTSDAGLNLLIVKENKFIHFMHQEGDSNSLGNNDIRSIIEDGNGNILIGTRVSGLNILDPESKKITRLVHDKLDSKSLPCNEIFSLAKDESGTIWIGTRGGGLCRLKSTKSGKYFFDNFRPISGNVQRNFILSLFATQHGGIWIGTENGGLDYFDIPTKSFVNYYTDEKNLFSINNNSVHAIYKDQTGNLWVGTYTGGVNVVKANKKNFYTYTRIPGNENSLSYNAASCFFEDEDDNLWIGTDGGGVNIWNRRLNQYQHYNSKNTSFKSDAVLSICQDQDHDIWVGGWGCGLNLYNRRNKTFTTFSNDKNNIPNNNIFDILTDQKGRIWIAFGDLGIARYDKKSGTFKLYSSNNSKLPSNWVLNLTLNYKGNIVLGHTNGFSIFDPDKETFENYSSNEKDTNSLSNDQVNKILQSHDSSLWIGTINGLNHFNPENKKFTRFYEQDGLPNNNINGLVEDNHGILWISTANGISKFDTKSGSFKNYTFTDGLQGNGFIRNSCFKTRAGEILFGGTNGYTIFHPDSLFDNLNLPKLIITDFTIFNKHVKVGERGSPLSKQISQTRQIVLSYEQNVISFEFAALEYTSPGQNQYAYKLEGFETDWNYIGTKRTATYTNLNPGKYILHAKCSNNDGRWNENGVSLLITITPPIWETWWFRSICLFAILFIISSYISIRTRNIKRNNLLLEIQVKERTKELRVKNRILRKQTIEMNETNVLLEERQQRIEEQSEILLAQKEDLIKSNREIFLKNKLLEKQALDLNDTNALLEERQQQIQEQSEELMVQKEELQNVNLELQQLNATKDKFFSIIAHDIKNPFNTIIGFSELLLKNYSKWTDEKKLQITKIIYDSSNGLAQLLENLLQWSRTQRGTIQFEPEKTELNKQINATLIILKESSEAKHIEIKTEFEDSEIILNADLRMIDTIIRNLVSNAIKFTHTGGTILIRTNIQDKYAYVSVTDNGLGMSDIVKANLFKINSHQLGVGTNDEKGTGLGLILVKEFVNKHSGEIWVESKVGEGSTFRFSLPLNLSL
jgi:signal transduction histidine kinase/ligand-binding sensor domain-containing protein